MRARAYIHGRVYVCVCKSMILCARVPRATACTRVCIYIYAYYYIPRGV